MTTADWRQSLQQLADLASVDTGYWDVKGTYQNASPEALVAILRALGIGIERPEGADDALRAHHAATWRRPLDPCAACFGGEGGQLRLRLPASAGARPVRVAIRLDSGDEIAHEVDLYDMPVVRSAAVDGEPWLERRLTCRPACRPAITT